MGTEIFRFFYILGFVNALFFSVLIFSKKEKSQADKILGSWFIALAIQLFWPFMYLSDIDKFIHVVGWEATIITVHPIFLYLYITVLTGQPIKKMKLIATFWPVLISIIAFVPFVAIPDEQLKYVMEGQYIPSTMFPGFIIIVTIIIYFTFKGFRKLKQHKNQTLHVFSYRDNVDLLWLRRLIVTFSLLLALSIPIGLFLLKFGLSLAITDFMFYAMLVGFIFVIGFWGYQQGSIFNLNQSVIYVAPKDTYAFEVEKEYKKEAAILKQVMEKEKPYLDPTLTIHQLGNQTNLQPHLLSKVIHKSFQKNFYEFINNYRIEYFKKLAASPKYKNYTLLGIAYECGFNSKSAFNRIFKEQTGMTPGAYKKQLT